MNGHAFYKLGSPCVVVNTMIFSKVTTIAPYYNYHFSSLCFEVQVKGKVSLTGPLFQSCSFDYHTFQ